MIAVCSRGCNSGSSGWKRGEEQGVGVGTESSQALPAPPLAHQPRGLLSHVVSGFFFFKFHYIGMIAYSLGHW